MKVAAAIASLAIATGVLAAPHAQIDLRNRTDAKGLYEISFCARPSRGSTSLPGHAFVAFSFLPGSGQRTFTAVGHTTDASLGQALLSYSGLVPVPGYLGAEHYTSIKENCLVASVNEEAYERAIRVAVPGIGAIASRPPQPVRLAYSLGGDDCIAYMTQVARATDSRIVVPARGAVELPPAYIRRLIEANSK